MPAIPSQVELPEITCKTLLIVEGDDETRFLGAFLQHKSLHKDVDIQIRKLNGKENRDEFAAILRDPGFPLVTAYAIIRDADTNAKATLESVQNLLKAHGQPWPKEHGRFERNGKLKVGIFIMPGNDRTGMIEDLCLESVADHPIMPNVEEFLTQVKTKLQKDAPKNESKAKVQAFLSGMKKTVPHLGVAAECRYWPFDHDAYSSLHHFIEELVEDNSKTDSKASD